MNSSFKLTLNESKLAFLLLMFSILDFEKQTNKFTNSFAEIFKRNKQKSEAEEHENSEKMEIMSRKRLGLKNVKKRISYDLEGETNKFDYYDKIEPKVYLQLFTLNYNRIMLYRSS